MSAAISGLQAKSECVADSFLEIQDAYGRQVARKAAFVGGLALLLVATAFISVSIGIASLGIDQVWGAIWIWLFPAQSTSSDAFAETVVMQGNLRNPLVSPYTLGLSGGAAFGAALAIVLGTSIVGPTFGVTSSFTIAANAFVFGALTMAFACAIARLRGMAPETLVLGGVALGYLFSAGVSALKYIAPSEVLRDLVVWLMGSMSGATWAQVRLLVPLVLACVAVLLRYSWDMNALAAGDEVATNLGVDVAACGWCA